MMTRSAAATKVLALLLCSLTTTAVTAYNGRATGPPQATRPSTATTTTKTSSTEGRRQFVSTAAATFAASLASAFLPHPAPAEAASLSDLTDVYFGVGCFWHIQHEFVEAERKLLGRGDKELTSLTGYAGGRSTDKEGRVCYHNFQSVADYGKLGHGEVVGMTIPESNIGDFAQEYFNLFTPKGGEFGYG
mmetsp:Transcript_24675/g.50650  ORF Transcript_24675/g.50650 Transcript_24675/m.50650 type:complete len:190 (+) Transcript_24675:54-623(+)